MADKPPTLILVVEDEGIVGLDIQRRLTNLGYSAPTVVATGALAVQRALELRPQLVLMDIRLKGDTDGIAAADHIRRLLDIPIVFLTAYADEDTLRRAVSRSHMVMCSNRLKNENYTLPSKWRSTNFKWSASSDRVSDGLPRH